MRKSGMTEKMPLFEMVSIVTVPAKEWNMTWCHACRRLVSIGHTHDSCAFNIATDVMES
jgi:hypothetical protein